MASSGVNPIEVAEKVLELAEVDDYAGILNIAATSKASCVDATSPHAAMRKLYLKLSLLIHPDKLGKKYPNATKAFQAVVKAFEYLTSPEVLETAQKGKSNAGNAIARSNDHCYRTCVCCPRCKQPWSENTLDGNPDYFYNFMMTGLKVFNCSTCLCEFGCMTARHHCPFCKKQIDYDPKDYHNQVKCNNDKCGKKFGFWMYHISDRAMKEAQRSVFEEQQQRMKSREAKQRRAARSSGRGRGAANTIEEQETAFMMGLRDVCPRCGEDLTETAAGGDSDAVLQHLMDCNDDEKHKAFKKSSAKKEKAEELKMKKAEAQEKAQTHASWQFLGSNSSQLYILDKEHLKEEAKKLNLPTSGKKEELIARIAKAQGTGGENGVQTITNSAASAARAGEKQQIQPPNKKAKTVSKSSSSSSTALVVASKASASAVAVASNSNNIKRKRADVALPTNLHSMGVDALRAVCASNGWLDELGDASSKYDILDFIDKNINAFYHRVETMHKS